jgi:diguanylate cyclase (GGDEF)-like protein
MIMVTGSGSEQIAVEAMKLGAGDYIVKDVDGGYLELLPTVIERVLQQRCLVEEKQRAEAERERLLVAEREQRLLAETLAEVTLALASLTTREAVLDEILHQAQRIVPYNTANIMLLEGDTLRIARWHGYETFGGEDLVANLVQSLDDFPLDAQAIRSREPVIVLDTCQEPRWVVFPDTAWIRSFLAVPICLHDRVLGLLRLDSDTPGTFSAEDVQRLQPLANAAAIALENARLFGEVQRLAITDGLTGTYNRRHFFGLAENELSRASRFGHPVSAIMLDVDHFKQVNDTYGHAVGDQVLCAVTRRCSESIRDIDILGRYGGEEFAIILPATDLSGAHSVAERLRRCVADVPIPTEQGDLTITISLGVASTLQPDGDVATLLNRADAAMYAAKQAGRNRVGLLK